MLESSGNMSIDEEDIKIVHSMSRRFVLRRLEDISGISGIGIVAEGIEFCSGMVALSWLSQHHAVNVYQSMRTVHELHGHQNRTIVEWVD